MVIVFFIPQTKKEGVYDDRNYLVRKGKPVKFLQTKLYISVFYVIICTYFFFFFIIISSAKLHCYWNESLYEYIPLYRWKTKFFSFFS